MVADEQKQRIIDEDARSEPRLWRWLRQFVLRRMWHTTQPVILMIAADPQTCLETLIRAARPSTQRLHQRNLFANGRRYHVQQNRAGFRLTTTRSVRWRYRKRTSTIAVMKGKLIAYGDDVTRVELRARVNAGYLLDTLLIPGLMAALLFYVPWSPVVIAVALGVLLLLSWVGHRAAAVLETQAMIWFAQKALEDLVPAEVAELTPQQHTVIREDFEQAWEKFYREHREK
jgi:hypothetical protein